MTGSPFEARFRRLRAMMSESGIGAAMFSIGPEIPWLCGYEAMPLERLTMLVVRADGSAVLVVPVLEAPRVATRGDLFEVLPWEETTDPVGVVAALISGAGQVAIGDRTWARFVIDLQSATRSSFVRASTLIDPLRRVKEPHEIETLKRAAAAADRVAAQLQNGEIALADRTEAQISDEISRRLISEGHSRVNFAIVASGPNSASPHHEAGSRVITSGDVVLCDFGGAMADEYGIQYCSDITRCVVVGEPTPQIVRAYAVLRDAQEEAVAAAIVGTAASAVDEIARRVLADGGFGGRCIHRVGHGIGVEAHEEPYLVAGNDVPLAAGEVFSVEPGIYLPGEWGLRLEDIVTATPSGPVRLNRANHALVTHAIR